MHVDCDIIRKRIYHRFNDASFGVKHIGMDGQRVAVVYLLCVLKHSYKDLRIADRILMIFYCTYAVQYCVPCHWVPEEAGY